MAIKIVHRNHKIEKKPDVSYLNMEVAQKVNNYHKTFPGYEPTPLLELRDLATSIGVKNILVKDEAPRFGLNAFKVLGGSYAIGQYIAKKIGKPIESLSFDEMISDTVRDALGELTFISATDGNHGRGVAWTVNQLQQNSVIYMPKGSAKERLENIRAEGAEAEITDLNYDDAVRLADQHANENDWLLVQDTSWPGYEEIPTHIMQGYMTLAYESYKQFDGKKPTHIFLQAGVGSFASAVTGFFTSVYGDDRPIITIVEPSKAACIYKTMEANDDEVHVVTGDMDTIMAGLACGEPVTVGIEILRHYASHYIACDDYVAAQGMRVLSSPVGDDPRIVSGESGAAGFGLAYECITNSKYGDIKEKLGINQDSVLFFVNTEGDTDKENYRKIVWDGMYSGV